MVFRTRLIGNDVTEPARADLCNAYSFKEVFSGKHRTRVRISSRVTIPLFKRTSTFIESQKQPLALLI